MTKQPCFTKNEITVKDYADTRFAAAKEYTDARIAAVNEATHVAHEGMQIRLEGMNEFRAALKDQAALFLARDEYVSMHQKVLDDIRELRESRAELAGKASQGSVMWAGLAAILGLFFSILSIAGHFLK